MLHLGRMLKWMILFIALLARVQQAFATGTSYSFEDGKLIQDKEHLQKELGNLIDLAIDNISKEHMEFYFFSLHDINKDKSLDGNELFMALSEASFERGDKNYTPSKAEEYLMGAVESILEETDTNDDGLVSWIEYLGKTRHFDFIGSNEKSNVQT